MSIEMATPGLTESEDSAPVAKVPAPVFKIPSRKIIAVEHPMIVQNIDNGIKTFGNSRPFQRIIESNDDQDIIPLYLRYNDPMATPILSHNSATNNLLLKITVPKCIGRKRKRRSQDPSSQEEEWMPLERDDRESGSLKSHSRMDEPTSLRRKLRDTKGRYTVEVAGEIRQSHRFRGLADFHHSTSNTEFFPKFRDTALTGKIEKLREFKLDMSRGWKPNEEFMPAPMMTTHEIPFNWGWHQNPSIFEEVDQATGQAKLVNRQGGKKVNLEYLSQHVASIPFQPPSSPSEDNEELLQLIDELRKALEERPIYTRRALVNRVGSSKDLWLFRDAIQYVGYQFKGGPFRDAVIKFGVDPRSDSKYRQYQTIFFKLFEEQEKIEGMQWRDVRTSYVISKKGATKEDRESHIFDGKTLVLDGKIWQLCDITDPLLAQLIRDAPYRDTCDTLSDGWFTNGTMAKIRAIMKTKLIAVRIQRDLTDKEFEPALRFPDEVPGKKSKNISIPVPDVRLTPEEVEDMKKRGLMKAVQSSGIQRKTFKGKARVARIRKHAGNEPKRVYRRRNVPASKPEPDPQAPWYLPTASALHQSLDGDAGPSFDRPLDSIEDEAMENTLRHSVEDAIGIDEIEEEGETGSSDDEQTDIEEDEISDGAENDYDSDETDIVDYRLLYRNNSTNGP